MSLMVNSIVLPSKKIKISEKSTHSMFSFLITEFIINMFQSNSFHSN